MPGVLNRVNRYSRAVSLVSGIFLVFTGGLLLSGQLLDVSASLIYYVGFGFGLEEILLSSTSLSLALAFLAGTLSLFSPCVLPLIPAYLGYMSGVSLAAETD